MPEIPAADMSRLLIIARLVAHDDLDLAKHILGQIHSEEAETVGKGLLGQIEVQDATLLQLLKKLRVNNKRKHFRAEIPA